ncbi:MAG: CRISPR-associated protein Cas5 [Bacillota bacterium]|jgi:CRISPR-associated protein Cas5 subtype I-B
MKKIVSARLSVPFWCSFRMPYTINVNFSYPVPPPITLYGLMGCALGLPADSYDLILDMEITVGIENEGEFIETYSRIIKRDPRTPDRRTLVIRQKLLQPVFRLYLLAEEILAEQVAMGLAAPAFPLSLGESDDILEIDDIGIFPYRTEQACVIDSILPVDCGCQPTSNYQTVVLPIAFKRGKRDWEGVDYRSYYVGRNISLAQPIEVAEVEGKKVVF